MAEGIITLGIGSEPDGLLWFFTLGLDTADLLPVTRRSIGTVSSPSAIGEVVRPAAAGVVRTAGDIEEL